MTHVANFENVPFQSSFALHFRESINLEYETLPFQTLLAKNLLSGGKHLPSSPLEE